MTKLMKKKKGCRVVEWIESSGGAYIQPTMAVMVALEK